MKTEPRIRSTHLILILALTAAMLSPLGLVNLSQVRAQTAPAIMVKVYVSIPEDQQKQVNNGFGIEGSTETPTPAHLSSPASPQPITSPSPTPANAETSLPNETQGTITFIAVSAATLILAVIAFAWILKRTKKPSQKRVRLTTQA